MKRTILFFLAFCAFLAFSSPLFGQSLNFDNAGNIGINIAAPTQLFHINGTMRLTGAFYDSNNQPGTSGDILTSTVSGTDWVAQSSLDDGDWIISGSNIYRTIGKVGVGAAPTTWKFSVFENTTTGIPQAAILQHNTSTGDASLLFRINNDITDEYTIGIDNDDSDNFKVTDIGTLTGNSYGDTNTMLRIHSAVAGGQASGIIDFNHQSRTRFYLHTAQLIPQNSWTAIEFEKMQFDEHVESIAGVPGVPPGMPGIPWEFIATEEGYYQVNSRIEFHLAEMQELIPGTTNCVSIAVWIDSAGVGYVIHSQGNNLQVWGAALVEPLDYNNAPNVSDVVYLLPGDKLQIHAWQSTGMPVPLKPGLHSVYVSVHKIS